MTPEQIQLSQLLAIEDQTIEDSDPETIEAEIIRLEEGKYGNR